MILWTIQHEPAWQQAERRGVLRADGRRQWRAFKMPYQWLVTEMTRRIGPPPRGVRYPIWAWQRRPDLRHTAHLPHGTAGALIEFAAEDENVLLSDFHLWHFVLNDWPPRERWPRMFDIHRGRSKRDIQANIWQVPMSSVISVKRFVAR